MLVSLHSHDQTHRTNAGFHHHRGHEGRDDEFGFLSFATSRNSDGEAQGTTVFIEAAEHVGRWHRGLDWYLSLFASEKTLCGEASPSYSNRSAKEGVLEQMHFVVPDAKTLYLVRERFTRLRSSYLMNVRYRGVEDSLPDFLQNNHWALDASMYEAQVQNILRYFSNEQLMVLEGNELQEQRENTLRSLFEFLGVDTGFPPPFSVTCAMIPGSTHIRTRLAEKFFAILRHACSSKNSRPPFFTTSGMD